MGAYKDAPSFSRHLSFIYQFLICLLLIAVFGPAICHGASTSGSSPGASSQAGSIPSLVKQPVNDAQRTILKGNIHPLARSEYDHGLAPDSLLMNRMLLVLKRSPQQEASLAKLLIGQQDKSSPDYHHWLTPQQFGQEFGPSDSDLQVVTDWLAAQGFEINRVTNGREVIEFSGSAGLVRQVFRTDIDQYVVQGKPYWANASDPQIPAALVPVVAGIASINNFPRRPMYRQAGVFSRSKKGGEITPLYTFNCPQGYTCNAPAYYALGPTDFATIYNVLPLWNAGTDGTGQTIAIVSPSNINPNDIDNFRSMFGLPANPVNVILNGPDPGRLINDEEIEADADTEWAGAVAKNATIDLVISKDTVTTAGVDLSALYIVDNNLAPVLSESYGGCEADLGTAGNAFENAMWEQAAAEGITVTVSSGDNGPAGCDYPGVANAASKGLAVSGVASTPFNVAVGGTDFDKPSNYFNTTSDSATQNSAKSYVPEIPWNDSCARAGSATGCSTVDTQYGTDLVAGGGGQSNCAVQDASGNCTSGYAKPAWQAGLNVPQDGLRDIPDISLFSGDGFDAAFYIVCDSDRANNITGSPNANCYPSSINTYDFLGIGGTSLSAPAFAGIMALVNQKTGQRQGNANFVLYPLAAAAAGNNADCASDSTAVGKSACVFYDVVHGHDTSGNLITPGTNSVACVAGSPNCNAPAGYPDGIIVSPTGSTTPAWATSTGYDLATGLGSVNVANLVSNWNSVSFQPTTTALINVTPTTITHGSPVTGTVTVTSSSGNPTDGDVELMATPAAGGTAIPVGTFTLNGSNSVPVSTVFIPGGSWNLSAHYAGDGIYGSSDSAPPVGVTVTPENSQPKITFVTFDPVTGKQTGISPVPPSLYGSLFYLLHVNVLNSAGQPCSPTTTETTTAGSFVIQGAPTSGCPTGTVAVYYSIDGSVFDGLTGGLLTNLGYFEEPVAYAEAGSGLGAGTGALLANYSGDASFNPSSSTQNYTIAKAPTTLAFIIQATQIQYGMGPGSILRADTTSIGALPQGTFTLFVDGAPYDTETGFEGTNGIAFAVPIIYAYEEAEFVGPPLSIGTHTFSGQYSGDSNYLGSTSATINVTVVKFQPSVYLSLNPNMISPGQQTTLTATVWKSTYGVAPTGTVNFADGGNAISGTVAYSVDTSNNLTASLHYAPTTDGTHNITASYSGDSNYSSAPALYPLTLTVQSPDFQVGGTDFSITSPGQSGTQQIDITSAVGWTGAVSLTCSVTTSMQVSAQYMPACSLNPASVSLTASNPQAVTTLTVSTVAPSAGFGGPLPPGAFLTHEWWITLLWLMMMGTLAMASRQRRRSVPLLAGAVLLAAITMSCGGGGGGGGGGGSTVTNPGTPKGTYTLTVTGVSGSLQHSTTVTLTVQ
jgi:Pro-kumamolisin, activation domain/Bacterial Ig-like domain (group 3)